MGQKILISIVSQEEIILPVSFGFGTDSGIVLSGETKDLGVTKICLCFREVGMQTDRKICPIFGIGGSGFDLTSAGRKFI